MYYKGISRKFVISPFCADWIMNEELETELPKNEGQGQGIKDTPLNNLYKGWFLDYASYVILERAVPAIEDGLKPVQRRILHAMNEMDDGRYNKVANIIGQTMQYHPHGDASIGDALVNMGQKDLLIDTQGNWGDVRTGDAAAAPRYIEARLNRFATEVLFNAKTTEWQLSYDGRKREPINLPVKFPLLLALGADGIAVGLSTKILPHNFCELIRASIDVLRGRKVTLYPDFPTGGYMDASNYRHGMRGGKVRVRARIEEIDKSTLAIRSIPYGVTTGTLIDSILKANDSGKVKVKNVTDNTARDVEILITLTPGVTTWQTMDALYAFTDCEVSLSPNTCVIVDEKPVFMKVEEALKISTDQTVSLLQQELQIRKAELLELLHFSSLEKVFIENRIYRKIEEAETYEAVIEIIDKALKPFRKSFIRDVTRDDIIKLTEIRIKRISKYDSFQADEKMKEQKTELDEVNNNLDNINRYAIRYFEHLLKTYGKNKERVTEIKTFDTIQAQAVAINNAKLYVNREEGFVGMGLKKDEFVCDCSDIDDVLVIRRDGKMVVSKIADKTFMGKDILYVGIYKRTGEGLTFNMIYSEGKGKPTRVKRFKPGGVTRDKEYELAGSSKDAVVLYLTANPNEETELVKIDLRQTGNIRRFEYEFDFETLAIKGRNSQGNIIARTPVKSIAYVKQTSSNVRRGQVWYDRETGRLTTDQKGDFIGILAGEDPILVVYRNGFYEIMAYEYNKKLDEQQVLFVRKFYEEWPVTMIYKDEDKGYTLLKRFLIDTNTLNRRFSCTPIEGQEILFATNHPEPSVAVLMGKTKKGAQTKKFALAQLEEVKKAKSVGVKFTGESIFDISQINEFPREEEQIEEEEEEEYLDETRPDPITERDSEEVLDKLLNEKKKNNGSGNKHADQQTLF